METLLSKVTEGEFGEDPDKFINTALSPFSFAVRVNAQLVEIKDDNRIRLPHLCTLQMDDFGRDHCFIDIRYSPQGDDLSEVKIHGTFYIFDNGFKEVEFYMSEDGLWVSLPEPEVFESIKNILSNLQSHIILFMTPQIAFTCDYDRFLFKSELPNLLEVQELVRRTFGESFGNEYADLLSHLIFPIQFPLVYERSGNGHSGNAVRREVFAV